MSDGDVLAANAKFYLDTEVKGPVVYHRLKNQDRSGVQDLASMIVLWLNTALGSQAYERVTNIYRLALYLDRGYRSWEEGPSTDSSDLLAELGMVERELNKILRSYVCYPTASYTFSNDGSVRGSFSVMPQSDNSMDDVWLLFDDPDVPIGRGSHQVATEGTTVDHLCRLLEKRKLRSVRLCENCELKWRVSTRAIDRFCGAECRTAFYMKSDDYKERQRTNQAKYRDNLKQNFARGYKGK